MSRGVKVGHPFVQDRAIIDHNFLEYLRGQDLVERGSSGPGSGFWTSLVVLGIIRYGFRPALIDRGVFMDGGLGIIFEASDVAAHRGKDMGNRVCSNCFAHLLRLLRAGALDHGDLKYGRTIAGSLML